MTTRPNRPDPLGQLAGKVAITLLALTRDQWVLLGQKLDYCPGWAYQQWQRHGSAA